MLFTGVDAPTFLQNQLTCNVAALAPGKSTYGAYCTPKGRMLASFLLWRAGEDYYMQLPSTLREPIQKQLTKFVLRSKVKIVDATDEWRLIGVAGERAGAVVEKAVGHAPREMHAVTLSPEAMVIRLPVDRYQIVAAREHAQRIVEALSAEAQQAGPEYWDKLDIEAGVPVVTPATQEALVPQMANLDLIGGVSFEKGCYPGQEIVARMHYRGTLKQRMYRAHVGGTEKPQPGDRLYSPAFGEQASGTVVSAAPSPEGGYEFLASIQIAAAEKADVRWKAPDGPAVKLLSLPYRFTA